MYENYVIEYNERRKKMSGITLFLSIGFILLAVVLYYSYFRKLGLFEGTAVAVIIKGVSLHIKNADLIGMFYTTLFGGFFFVVLPLEILFVRGLLAVNSSFYVIVFYLLGLIISYVGNYVLGLRFSRIFKNFINVKQFYKIKGMVNRYGGTAIFIFNALPLPSQPLTFMLGVFKYNKTRLVIFSLTGQVLKLTVITLLFIFFRGFLLSALGVE